MMECGELCVTTTGVSKMPVWSAENWATSVLSLLRGLQRSKPGMER